MKRMAKPIILMLVVAALFVPMIPAHANTIAGYTNACGYGYDQTCIGVAQSVDKVGATGERDAFTCTVLAPTSESQVQAVGVECWLAPHGEVTKVSGSDTGAHWTAGLQSTAKMVSDFDKADYDLCMLGGYLLEDGTYHAVTGRTCFEPL